LVVQDNNGEVEIPVAALAGLASVMEGVPLETVKVTFTLLVMVPPVPVTVITYCPDAALASEVKFNELAPVAVKVVKLKVAVTPVGTP
jgi:hypothetical protein